MKTRKFWLIFAITTTLLAGGLAWLSYHEIEHIENTRTEVSTLRANIDKSRKLIEGTPGLEDEVIVLREVSDLIKQILPDQNDVNNFIKTLNGFSADAGMNTTAFKKKQDNRNSRDKSDFEKVAYTLSLEGDVFQFLGMLNSLETHKRFVAVPAFKLSAASRRDVEDNGLARHHIQLDVETYKYDPKTDLTTAKIEGYERKRDLLAGEINRRRAVLTLASYEYRGPRGRRDPWIDPRVPAGPEKTNGLTVPEQIALVEAMAGRVILAKDKWKEVEDAPDVLRRMVARQDLAEMLASLDDDLRVVATEGQLSYGMASRRLEKEVSDPVKELRLKLTSTVDVLGPPREVLAGVRDGMRSHLALGEFVLAIKVFGTVQSELGMVRGDSVREVLAEEILQLADDATILQDFDKIPLDIGGIALIEGMRPSVLINGRAVTVGDMINVDVEVFAIRKNEIEFIFRGVILTRSILLFEGKSR